MADEDYDAGGEDGFDQADTFEEIAEGEELQETGEREVGKESRALQILTVAHPECRIDYIEESLHKLPLEAYPPDNNADARHRSYPFLTIFEKTKLIGFRANQLAEGGRPFINVPPHVTDVVEIARLELEQKRLPFILKRTMPDGTFEYWRLTDLMIL
jgi:DNA-directed RNA polymerase subunit K/omega